MIVLGVDVPGKFYGGYGVYDSTGKKVLGWGKLTFPVADSERMHYVYLWNRLDDLKKRFPFTVVAIEHPFLYLIAQHIGAVKMWVARHSGISWYMVTASSARKAVFGDARKITRTTRTGSIVPANKEFVLQSMQERVNGLLTQHEADGILYAIAGAVKLSQPPSKEQKK